MHRHHKSIASFPATGFSDSPGFSNPQARKGLHVASINTWKNKKLFFGSEILIFNCVGLQIPRDRGISERVWEFAGCICKIPKNTNCDELRA